MQRAEECDGSVMRIGVMTDIGKARRTNEDAFLAEPPWFAVADGMGGHAAGDVASRLAIEAVRSFVAGREDPAETVIVEAIRKANGMIWRRSQENRWLDGMGTTLTLMKVESGRCVIGHVGDSRGYLVRDGAVRRLTTDHSVVEELVRTGTLSERDALEHPQRNLLTRALGANPDVQVDLVTEPLMAGDRLLLCTDGLTAVVLDHELGEILTEEAEPEKAAARLVQIANARGGPDNITVVVLELPQP